MSPPRVTRRTLVFGIGSGLGLGLVPGVFTRPAAGLGLPSPGVATVFADRPLLDFSDRLERFRPPRGARSCDGVAGIDEATLRCHHFTI